MFLLILGVIIAVVGIGMARGNPKNAGVGRIVMFIGVAMGIFGFFNSFIVILEPGRAGVQVLFGDVQKGVLESGVNVVNPLVSIDEYNIQTQNYTMSSDHQESDRENEDAIQVLTADGLEVTMDVTVQYYILHDSIPTIRRRLGVEEAMKNKIIRPYSRNKVRDIAVQFDAVSLYGVKRDTFQMRLNRALVREFQPHGIHLEAILIRHISLPASVKGAIESKINAEQDAQKMAFVLQKEKQEAERKRVEAQGIADYQRIIASGLGDRQLQYEQIKAQIELAKSPNTKIIIMGNNKGVPIMVQ